MTDTTARLALPMIAPGQAQKEVSHNEALARLDAAVQASVVTTGLATPPADPATGDCWIVGAAADGAWSGHADDVAVWTSGGWRFVTPTPGFRAWVADVAVEACFIDGAWVVGTVRADRLLVAGNEMLASPSESISDPAGGATIDSAARTSIAAILSVLRHHNLLQTA